MGHEVTTKQLLDDLKTVVRDGSELLKQSAGDLSDKAHEARERLNQALDSAKATISRLEGKAKDGARATDELIREHPYQTIGIAFAVGLLIGVLVNRNHK